MQRIANRQFLGIVQCALSVRTSTGEQVDGLMNVQAATPIEGCCSPVILVPT